jgi:hypothetical protein
VKLLFCTCLIVAGGLAAVVAIFAGADHFKIGWVEIPVHYRLSFSVEVEGASYTGSTVVQVTYRTIPHWQLIQGPGIAAIHEGQAGCVRIKGNKIVCLMPGAQNMIFGEPFYSTAMLADRLLSINGSPTGPKQKWLPINTSNARTVAGSSDIPIDLLPPIIVLDDPTHPSSVHLFDPKRPEPTLGARSRFLGAEIAVTTAPVSDGIEAMLPWLDPARPRRLTNVGDPFEQENRGYPLYSAYFY